MGALLRLKKKDELKYRKGSTKMVNDWIPAQAGIQEEKENGK